MAVSAGVAVVLVVVAHQVDGSENLCIDEFHRNRGSRANLLKQDVPLLSAH